jgi:hypothetical protein
LGSVLFCRNINALLLNPGLSATKANASLALPAGRKAILARPGQNPAFGFHVGAEMAQAVVVQDRAKVEIEADNSGALFG